MGAGSQSRFNRLLPGVGFRDRSRHKGVHCVRDGYSLEMPARIAPMPGQAFAASFDGVASSGQILCQSDGRRSWRVTAPSVACSMATQY